MNIYLRGLALIISFHVMVCLVSCCDEGGCIESKLNSITADMFDNTGQFPVEITQDSSSLSAAGFKIELTFDGEITHEGPCIASRNNLSGWLITNAQAMKCPSPEFSSPDTLDFVNIRSVADFNDEYPAGANLVPLFVDDFRDGKNDRMTDFPFWGQPITVNYLLFSEPDSTRWHQFIIEAHMTSGRILSDTTLYIELVP